MKKKSKKISMGLNMVKKNEDWIVIENWIGIMEIGGERIEREENEKKGNRKDYREIIKKIKKKKKMIMMNNLKNIVVRNLSYKNSELIIRK